MSCRSSVSKFHQSARTYFKGRACIKIILKNHARSYHRVGLISGKHGKVFWSWVNYVWLHLHSSQRTVKRLLWLVDIEYQKYISRSVTRWLSLYRSLPRMLQLYPASNSYFMTSRLLFWNIFLEILWANSVHIKYFQSYVDAFIEQDQNTENSKASIAEVVSCFATVKARIQVRQSDVHIKPK